ncbi:alpha/beta hydrolase [Streptomyces sp. NPDC059875]|uniref:alpha/beta hydrolase n=1 Tax=unclassified Streptomyces TaxID=2593676 RepID=UPI0036537502
MTLRRALGVLGTTAAVTAAVGIAARHRALATIPPELRHPVLYLPLNFTNAAALAVGRRLVSIPGSSVRSGIDVEQRTVAPTATEPAVTVLTYQAPNRPTPSGALLWIHGGGTIMGSARQAHAWCSRVAEELGVLVITVEYRLAPENPYPAALNDCYSALRWLHDNATDLGIDPARIIVGGESAGGGLAATVAQRAHDTGLPVRFQLLIYPMLDDRTVLRAEAHDPGVYTWTPASNLFAWTAYLGRPPAERDERPYIAAARRGDLTGLPPAWIGVGDIDLFHDEDVEYAHRLHDAGVACELHIEPGMYHGADELLDGKASSMTAFRNTALDALRNAMTTP